MTRYTYRELQADQKISLEIEGESYRVTLRNGALTRRFLVARDDMQFLIRNRSMTLSGWDAALAAKNLMPA